MSGILPLPLDEIVEHVRPVTSTTPSSTLPDLGPGQGQARGAGLDETAEATTNVPTLPSPPPAHLSESEQLVGADLDDALAAARARAERASFDTLPPPHDPLTDRLPRTP